MLKTNIFFKYIQKKPLKCGSKWLSVILMGEEPIVFFRLCCVYILGSKYSFLQEMIPKVQSWYRKRKKKKKRNLAAS